MREQGILTVVGRAFHTFSVCSLRHFPFFYDDYFGFFM